jgi:hypothetical protein
MVGSARKRSWHNSINISEFAWRAKHKTSVRIAGVPDEIRTKHSRATVQAAGGRLPAATTRVPSYVRLCGICGERSGTKKGFLVLLRFPLPLIPPTVPHPSSSINRGRSNRPNSGRRNNWSQSHPTLRKNKQVTCSIRVYGVITKPALSMLA